MHRLAPLRCLYRSSDKMLTAKYYAEGRKRAGRAVEEKGVNKPREAPYGLAPPSTASGVLLFSPTPPVSRPQLKILKTRPREEGEDGP
jgi:hypothetical protein